MIFKKNLHISKNDVLNELNKMPSLNNLPPKQPSKQLTNDKPFKDTSKYYKSYVPDAANKVYTEILSHHGYEIKKVRLRSERVPIIGDKICSKTANMAVL